MPDTNQTRLDRLVYRELAANLTVLWPGQGYAAISARVQKAFPSVKGNFWTPIAKTSTGVRAVLGFKSLVKATCLGQKYGQHILPLEADGQVHQSVTHIEG